MIAQIQFSHQRNLHTVEGAKAALKQIFRDGVPRSLLDVGCGIGCWSLAASELGVERVVGIDGIYPGASLVMDEGSFRQVDLRKPFDLAERFDVVLCLEVAEHLDSSFAMTLVESLVRHAGTIYFSAACPGQNGDHHVNLQWPSYWCELFKSAKFVCEDQIRWRIWTMEEVEPWYRQNMFTARAAEIGDKFDSVPSVIHPRMLRYFEQAACEEAIEAVRQARCGLKAHTEALLQGILTRIRRRIFCGRFGR